MSNGSNGSENVVSLPDSHVTHELDRVSESLKDCNTKLDTITRAVVRIEAHMEGSNNRIQALEKRQDLDEKLRIEEQGSREQRLRQQLLDRSKDSKSRRNYWIGIIVAFVMGIGSTVATSCLKDPQQTQIQKHKPRRAK